MEVLQSTIEIEDIIKEAGEAPYNNDSLGIMFNNLGLLKFKSMLTSPQDGTLPLYTLPLNAENVRLVLEKIPRLFPYTKGVALKLTAPQKRRKLITYVNDIILDFIDRTELETSVNIIHELTANAEKANLEHMVYKKDMAKDASEVPGVIRSSREELLSFCDQNNKWVRVSWKFTHKIFKLEVKNNTPIDPMGLNNIKYKVSTKLNTIADGFIGEMDDKIGAGLGLFFVNFFKDEMKEKYDFETIFRVYESDFDETIASLTVIFEKN